MVHIIPNQNWTNIQFGATEFLGFDGICSNILFLTLLNFKRTYLKWKILHVFSLKFLYFLPTYLLKSLFWIMMRKTIPIGPTTGLRTRLYMKIDISADMDDCFLNKKWIPYMKTIVPMLMINKPRTVMNRFLAIINDNDYFIVQKSITNKNVTITFAQWICRFHLDINIRHFYRNITWAFNIVIRNLTHG